MNDDLFRVCNFKLIEKTINRIFSTKKNNVNFFLKIDNDNLKTKNNNAFFFRKQKHILHKNELKQF